MNLNDYITWGLDSQGKRLWETIDRKYPTLHEALTFLRELQEAQAKFSPRLGTVTEIQLTHIRHQRFIEMLARRRYMIGNGREPGEFQKRLKNDRDFHLKLDPYKKIIGPPGCGWPGSMHEAVLGIQSLSRCWVKKCRHNGAKKAVGWLKQQICADFDRDIWPRYRY